MNKYSLGRPLALSMILMLGACSALDGVNVGANLPIGIGNIGVNTTVDTEPSGAPRSRTNPPQTENEEDESGET